MAVEAAKSAVPDVPDYVVGERLGAGGFGEVFRARHAVIGREVAIKILHEKYSSDPDAVARFVAEAQAVNRVSHPGIVEIFDFGELANGRRYCVMELVRGTTLRDVLRDRGRLPLDEALPILRAIAGALDAAHAAGIAHRDLKPDNVFVLDGGGVKLIDFGLAKLVREQEAPVTETGAVFGTPMYMSPEQCRGKGVTTATDAYAFGVLAYHVLAGEPPFSGDALSLALHHLNDTPERPSARCAELPAHVDRLVLALLAKDPAERPMPLVAAIDGHVPLRRRRRWWPLAAVAFAAIAIGVVLLVRRGGDKLAFSQQAVHVQYDGSTAFPTLTPDGSAFLYVDRNGWWRYTFATRTTDHIASKGNDTNAGERPDGTLVLSRAGKIELVAKGKATTFVMDGDAGSLSPDGRYGVTYEDGWLVVRDLDARTQRRLVAAGAFPIAGIRWSRDGSRILYSVKVGDRYELRVTAISDGTTRTVPVSVLAIGTDSFGPAAFLDDGRIVYCALDGEVRQLRVRSIDDDHASDSIVATLEPNTRTCSVDSVKGDRLLVEEHAAPDTIATIDTAHSPSELHIVSKDRAIDQKRLMAIDVLGEHVFTAGTEEGKSSLLEVSLATGELAKLSTCSGDTATIRRGSKIVRLAVAKESGVYSLQLREPGSCASLATWRLPYADSWPYPRCADDVCVVARTTPTGFELWKLVAGQDRGTVLRAFQTTKPLLPEIAISPDGRWAVVCERVGPTEGRLYLVSIATGDVRKIATSWNTQYVAWSGDADHFLVSGMVPDGTGPFVLVKLDLDGHEQRVWSSSSTWIVVGGQAGDRIVVNARPPSWTLTLFDRVH
jgi:tRNA A-37 threonylcarbamoyl transferase component Bud32